MRVEQVVVGEVALRPEHEERRHARVLERRRRGGHLTVGGNDGRLAVAVAPAAVVVEHEVAAELLLHERSGRAVQLALVVAAFDRFLERHVGALRAGVLGGEERHLRREVDRRVEQDESPNQLRPPRGELEGKPAAERVPDPVGRLAARPPPRSRRGARRATREARTATTRARAGPAQARASSSASQSSASSRACPPWLVTPWRKTTRGAPLVAPAVQVELRLTRTVPSGRRDRPTVSGPRPRSGGASPPDCTLPRIVVTDVRRLRGRV